VSTTTGTTGDLAALIARYAEIDATLTSAGMPFEVQHEAVRGESMPVYVNRPTSTWRRSPRSAR